MHLEETPLKTCIYCNLSKPANEFSLEHIFPEALGGKLLPDLFKTRDVCERCNNIAGLYVDGAFIKSWFRTNDDALASQSYLDLKSQTSIYPLSYMGVLTDVALDADDICETWLGPCGVHYYHVHKADEPKWNAYTGGNPIARKADPGRAYIRLTTLQPDWVLLAFRSFMAYFPNARRYTPDGEVSMGPGVPEFVHAMDASAKAVAEKILAVPDSKLIGVTLDIAFEQRFMAKFALGIGYKIFGSTFLDTPYGKALRGAFREADLEKRAAYGLRGAGFLKAQDDSSAEFMGWKGAYTVRMQVIGQELVLSLHFPSSRAIHLVVSNEPSLWSSCSSDFAAYREGVVYIVVPQLGECAGPIPMGQYVAHRLGGIHVPALDALEGKLIDPATLPQCR